MKLDATFWKRFELDLQEVKLAYLNWAIGYAKESKHEYLHLFIWNENDCFMVVNSRYAPAFSISPFGVGVRGVPRIKSRGIPRGLDEIDMALKYRLTESTRRIRTAIVEALHTLNLDEARQIILDYYWLKLGPHELLFDRIQYRRDDMGKVRKGKWAIEDESESWKTLTGIRNRTQIV
jgi:hypothetical protein